MLSFVGRGMCTSVSADQRSEALGARNAGECRLAQDGPKERGPPVAASDGAQQVRKRVEQKAAVGEIHPLDADPSFERGLVGSELSGLISRRVN